MLNPLEIITLSRDRYEARLREAERDHEFDRVVEQLVRHSLSVAMARAAVLLKALIGRAQGGFRHSAGWQPEPSSK